MKKNNVLFLGLFLAFMSCSNKDDGPLVKVIPDPYTIYFTTLTCDPAVDAACLLDASKSVTTDVEIQLFETQEARDAGEPIFKSGLSDELGSISFTNLVSQDYFYRAIHPTPVEVQEEFIMNVVSVTPNNFNFFEEILFVEK